MPIHRGPRLDDVISRLGYAPIPLQANIYQVWPSAANAPTLTAATWIQMIAAANAPTQPFSAFLGGREGSDDAYGGGCELGVGASGSEVAIASTWYQNKSQGFYFFDPLPVIPGGSRVSLKNVSGLTPKGALQTVLLPSRRSVGATLRYALKYSDTRYYPGISPLWNAIQGIPVTGGAVAWGFGSWTEIYNSTVETNPVLITQLTIASFDNQVAGQVEFGYGGTDGAGNAPTATWGQFSIGYPQGGSSYVHYMRLPVPVLWPASTRLTARFANKGGIGDSVYVGLSGVRLPYYP